MAEYVKINGTEYSAQISGVLEDYSWDKRPSKTITFAKNVMTYANALALFVEGASWSIISEWQEEQFDEEGNPYNPPQYITKRQEYDNSDYNMAGAITDNRDGVISVKMGKMNDLESLLEDIYGGEA